MPVRVAAISLRLAGSLMVEGIRYSLPLAMARNIDDVVKAAHDKEVTVLIHEAAVAGFIVAVELTKVSLDLPIMTSIRLKIFTALHLLEIGRAHLPA
jgi:hypothetical protein